MRPSRVAPSLTRIELPEVGPEARNTSSRVITIFTGRPAFCDRRMATGSRYTTVLPPKPPPISAAMTRICDVSRPSSRLQKPRTWKWPCVVVQSWTWPSSAALARQACGSM